MGESLGKRKRYGKHRRSIRINGKSIEASFSSKEDADRWYASMLQKKELISKGIDIGFQAKTFEEWSGRWLADRRAEIEDSTFRSYNGFLTNDLLPVLGPKYLHMITAQDIKDVLYSMKKKRSISNQTFNLYRSLLSTIFSSAMKCRPQHVRDNPLMQVAKLTSNPAPTEIFEDPAQMEKYISGARQWKIHFWIGTMILLNAGVRLGEMLAIRPKDVRFDMGMLHICRSKDCQTSVIKEYPKGKRHRMVKISDELAAAIRFYLGQHPRTEGETIVHYSSSGFHAAHDRLCKNLELPALTVHELRHTWATHSLDITKDIRWLQETLGHRDISTTQRYAHLTKERLHKTKGLAVGAESVDLGLKLVGVKG